MKNKSNNNDVLSFSAVIEFTSDHSNDTIDVTVSKSLDDLTYDEVEDAVYTAVDKRYGYSAEDFIDDDRKCPYSIVDIVINADDGVWPVVSETADIKGLKKTSSFEKFLVLPWATYGLTPECALWMAMKEDGSVDADEPFDYDKYHALVEAVNGAKRR